MGEVVEYPGNRHRTRALSTASLIMILSTALSGLYTAFLGATGQYSLFMTGFFVSIFMGVVTGVVLQLRSSYG